MAQEICGYIVQGGLGPADFRALLLTALLLDSSNTRRYNESVKRRGPKAAPFEVSGFSESLRNRHLAEWRFLLFTRMVTVQKRM